MPQAKPNAKVSRKHALIKCENGERMIENLAVNSTKISGRDVDEPSILRADNAIFIANYILVNQPDEQAEEDLDGTTIMTRAAP